jgi:hypothetical protein
MKWGYILGAYLYDAWAFLRQCQERSIVEVMCEHNKLIRTSPIHQQ